MGSMIIMNLLIAVAIHNINKLHTQAESILLKNRINEMESETQLWIRGRAQVLLEGEHLPNFKPIV